MALDEPLRVVGVGPGSDGVAELIDGVMQLGPQALFFEGADEAFGAAVGLGLTDVGGVVGEAEPGNGAQEVVGAVLGSPVVTQLDAAGGASSPRRSMTAS